MKRTIRLEPVPKFRARQRFINGKVISYTPTKTAKAQKATEEILKTQWGEPLPPRVPLKLTVTFWRQKPKWIRPRESMPVRKPDTDNFLKLFMDALSGIAYNDDAQVVKIIANKWWTPGSQAMKRGQVRPPETMGYTEYDLVEYKL